MPLVSKGEFAAAINVSPGRVSQFIKAGQISAAAIVGHGQRAKIDLELAKADLRLCLDVSQRFGNGLDTRLDPDAPVTAERLPFDRPPPLASTLPSEPLPPNIDLRLKQAKLEQAERANRNAAIEDAKERGRLMETSEASRAMGRVATSMLEIFEGGLNDMATAISAAFQLPERDVKHLMRQQFRKVRESASKQMRLKAVALPDLVESEIATELEVESS
ncbi:hypothetical protein [Rhizobium sp. RU36D]|uniref:hypothetical protein n=1 Tax=Rhizobium sp. RU36D TaxID=1907415 RepID=UPI0009D82188|nr:hypothetical protein [Rhizobium sp. RU36D]SMD18180.1 hypothetical protein SAMN05880593_13432 [Rhizobium sp. RU36D]